MDPQLSKHLNRRRLISENFSGDHTVEQKQLPSSSHDRTPSFSPRRKCNAFKNDEKDFLKKIQIFESLSNNNTGNPKTDFSWPSAAGASHEHFDNKYFTSGRENRNFRLGTLQKIDGIGEHQSVPPSSVSVEVDKLRRCATTVNRINFRRRIAQFTSTRSSYTCTGSSGSSSSSSSSKKDVLTNKSVFVKSPKSDYNNWEIDSKWTYVMLADQEEDTTNRRIQLSSDTAGNRVDKKSKSNGLMHNTIKLFFRRWNVLKYNL